MGVFKHDLDDLIVNYQARILKGDRAILFGKNYIDVKQVYRTAAQMLCAAVYIVALLLLCLDLDTTVQYSAGLGGIISNRMLCTIALGF